MRRRREGEEYVSLIEMLPCKITEYHIPAISSILFDSMPYHHNHRHSQSRFYHHFYKTIPCHQYLSLLLSLPD